MMSSPHASNDQHSRIPVTVIGGEPNAGKTSLVRSLLEQSEGRRVVGVVKETAVIDPSLVARREGRQFILKNGCRYVITDDDDAATVLAALADQTERPDHVIVDGSGATDPRRLTGYGYMPGYCLDGAIVVLDAQRVLRSSGESAGDWQLREHAIVADVILLNKVDLVGDGEADEAQRIVERMVPTARVVCCEHSRISPALILGASEQSDGIDARTVVAEWKSDFMPFRSRPRISPRSGGFLAGEKHRAWCLVSDAPIDAREFRSWVQKLPPQIMCGRGAVFLRDEPQHRQTFRLLGSRWRLERSTPWGGERPSTRLMLAGLGGGRRASRRDRGPGGAEDAAASSIEGEVA
jgi:G3E family GTPase